MEETSIIKEPSEVTKAAEDIEDAAIKKVSSEQDTKIELQRIASEVYNKISNNLKNRDDKVLELFSEYLNNFKKRTKINRRYKSFSFYTTLSVFVVLTIGVVVGSCFIIILNDFENWQVAISLLSIGATYVGAIIPLLKVIAEYLFNKHEEENTARMISRIIENDTKVQRTYLEKAGF